MRVDITECYGIKCIDCEEFCDFKDCGVNVIREKQQELSRFNGTNGNVVYIDAMGDADDCDSYNEDGEPTAEVNHYLDDVREREADGCNWMFLEQLGIIDKETPEEVKEEGYQIVLEFIRRIYPIVKESPQGFIDLCASVLDGERQADRAKKASISREAQRKRQNKSVAEISKALGVRKDKEAAILGLTADEFTAYKVLFVDGCSLRSAATQLKTNLTKAYRLKQILRVKLQKSETPKKAVSKKNAKKMTRAEVIQKAIEYQQPKPLKGATKAKQYKGFTQGLMF